MLFQYKTLLFHKSGTKKLIEMPLYSQFSQPNSQKVFGKFLTFMSNIFVNKGRPTDLN